MDGTNNTLNSGRFLINLKPKSSRDGVTDVMDRLAQDAHAVPGITFYLQPVQDLTIDSVVSRAEYQFVLQSATTAALNDFVPKLIARVAEICRAAQRLHRFSGQGPVGLSDGGPRHRGALRHHRRDHRQCAVRCLRPAHHLDHLHPVQPVSRDPGGRSQAAEHASPR